MSVQRATVAVAGGRAGVLTTTGGGSGPPIVLLHGAGGRAEVWQPLLEGLADLGRVIAVDLPGHGTTSGHGYTSIADYAAWVLGFLDALALEPVVLGGHSMGGAIAQRIALDHPHRLAGLLLVGTGARLRVLQRVLELFREDASEGRRLVGGLSYSPTSAASQVREAETALAETPPGVVLGDFLACDRFDAMAEVRSIGTPTLVVVGADDRLTPPRYAEYLASTIAGARLAEIPGAGHFPQLEQPAAVLAAVRAFLEAPG